MPQPTWDLSIIKDLVEIAATLLGLVWFAAKMFAMMKADKKVFEERLADIEERFGSIDEKIESLDEKKQDKLMMELQLKQQEQNYQGLRNELGELKREVAQSFMAVQGSIDRNNDKVSKGMEIMNSQLNKLTGTFDMMREILMNKK